MYELCENIQIYKILEITNIHFDVYIYICDYLIECGTEILSSC